MKTYKIKYINHKNIVITEYMYAESQEQAEEFASHIQGSERIISVKEATV